MDRRIDPMQPLELVRTGATPAEIVAAAAESLQLGVAHLGPVLYIAPPATAERFERQLALQTAAARRLPAAQAKRWARRAPLAWSDLAEPRAILTELTEEEKISARGLENVPHDLWPAAAWPPLNLVERLTLVLAQFELTWRFEDDGRELVIVPLSAEQTSAKPTRYSAPRSL